MRTIRNHNLPRRRRVRGAHVRRVAGPRVVYTHVATMIPDGMHGIEDGYHNGGWRAGRPEVVNVSVATMIPDGMHAAAFLDKRRILDDVVEGLVAKGVDPYRARILVNRVAMKYQTHGLGEVSADALASVTADARNVQDAHRRMIGTMASWEERNPGWMTTDDDLRRTFEDQLTALKNGFVQRSLPLLGVDFPYQIDRTDPAGAVVLAVRDDIQQTADLLDQRKAQQLLQRNIAELSKVPLPSAPPSINIDIPAIPWYVWAAGGGVGLLALHLITRK